MMHKEYLKMIIDNNRQEDTDMYVRMAIDFLNDIDAKLNKLYNYYSEKRLKYLHL